MKSFERHLAQASVVLAGSLGLFAMTESVQDNHTATKQACITQSHSEARMKKCLDVVPDDTGEVLFNISATIGILLSAATIFGLKPDHS
jgi:hypothetical protein